MRCNVAGWDQMIRLILGTLTVAWAIAGGPWWAYLGLALIISAAWRFCPLYSMLRISTARTRQ